METKQFIKVDCYGENLNIPIKYKERIGIINTLDNKDSDISLEISKSDMIQILYVLRDNLQALDKYELEDLRRENNWTKIFLKHFDYLNIDTEAINNKMKENLGLTICGVNKEIVRGNKIHECTGFKYLSESIYNKNKSLIDKEIMNSKDGKKYKKFIVTSDICKKHTYIIFYNDNEKQAKDAYIYQKCSLC